MTTLVRSGTPEDHRQLGARRAELEATLATREAEYTKVKAALDAFKIKYREQVGLLHEQLDELERQIAEAELGELSKRVDTGARASTESSAQIRPEPAPRYTSDGVRRLFRDVAKAIHPDLARDEQTRDQRHRLMIEANKAYATGDEERLRSILQAWERSPEAVSVHDPEAARLRLERRVAQLAEQIELCAADLAALKETPIWKLKVMVDEASRRGKDLIRDMVRRLKRDILVARNRLDAMQSTP